MKKIINGKMYNTETAKLCGCWSNGVLTNSFSYEEERLYMKKTGEFFVYGTGGPMSSYAYWSDDNGISGGSIITPLSESDAKVWAEKHLDADDYIEIFGEVEE